MRGDHARHPGRGRRAVGIIPACAGSTPWVTLFESWSEGSSPHARGAPGTSTSARPCRGDHPRMRGEHVRVLRRVAANPGIIPACAGSTSSSSMYVTLLRGSSPHARGAPPIPTSCASPRRDHPRMRGEHSRHHPDIALSLGIIPACAGSTRTSNPARKVVRGSSPHARGALPCATRWRASSLGSSPHARGARRRNVHCG